MQNEMKISIKNLTFITLFVVLLASRITHAQSGTDSDNSDNTGTTESNDTNIGDTSNATDISDTGGDEEDEDNTGGGGGGGGNTIPPKIDPNMNPAAMKLLSDALFKRFNNLSNLFTKEQLNELKFCIMDMDAEWNAAFNFSKNTDFLVQCLKTTPDVSQRLCTAAEVKIYGQSLIAMAHAAEGGKFSKSGNYMQPNKNCNLTSWPEGCEPGWGCGTGGNKSVDMKNEKEIPDRTFQCQACCEGFFCPHGLTCMIPCPLGSYCPMATLNKTTGVCDPYKYQLPPGQPAHTCGGADLWADYVSGPDVFCSAGFYCPSNNQKIPCNKGHFCRAGSTEQTKCYQLATCEKQAVNQNITAYGLMFFGGITLILMIIYNCSGQVLNQREKKQAKSREAAARSARETAQARQKWSVAKDTARKQVSELGSSLSRTFSRRKPGPDLPKASGQPKPGSDQALPTKATGNKKDNKLTKMMQDLEENPDGPEGFDMDIGDRNLKKSMQAKKLQTRSQIFKYAYGQIEKEKAMAEQNKNMTFSGVINMTEEFDIVSRPPMEVFFQDLTLTLSGKNKHLLRCVTGKLIPGHVSAVMGPSGAGKTTFLSALTGKAAGCTVTGSILINGKNDPMQSFKRIIGYVPQDDIVHGNLTVEENLWFSARCRLAAELSKPERVLVVERVISSLGLEPIRDSLVGTVEKRGISGGQRKRVNVGLEMVMEPSLLILDEPTSGLDSSSSQLLLRALRREALEGVNIIMVVHQPSYTLFKMFDDLILLAKGGLTVYHGPVKKVEEYFAGLGINVPERVNPPDYFIDILEGIVKPSASATVNFKELPLRWMLHNGYAVPSDMLDSAGLPATSSTGDLSLKITDNAHHDSFIGELWKDFVLSAKQRMDHLSFNYNKSEDLSNRLTPNHIQQYKYFVGRLGKQRLREARIQAVDYLILLLAGICLGTIAKVSDETFGSTGYLYTVIAVSLLCKISAMRSFSLDKLHYWRESSSGMSSLAYFLAKDTVDHFNTIIKPAVYLSMFYFFNNPRSTIIDNYVVLLCLVYCVTGIAYVLAIYFEPSQAQLWSVLLPVVLTLVANQEGDELVSKFGDYCYTKWALEGFMVANAKRYSGVWLIQRCGVLQQKGYKLNHYYSCLAYLMSAGIASRALAFFCLVTFQKK